MQGRTDEIVVYATCAPRGEQGENPSLFGGTGIHRESRMAGRGNVMEEIKDILLEKIKDAELVLVGIGEEFQELMPKMEKDPDFSVLLKRMEKEEEDAWMYPYLRKIYMDMHCGDKTGKAYHILENLLDGKNYFVVSTRTDDYIYKTKILKERIVTPCGGYQFCRCGRGCNKQLYPADQQLPGRVYDYCMGKEAAEKAKPPICPVCGQKLVFNLVGEPGYIEEGYLPQWNQYMKWLQGTVNKRLCVLELGVGMKYPTVIRWPFEKVVFFNQKSNIFRVHSKLYQLTEEISDRGYKVEKKPIDFLINGFV